MRLDSGDLAYLSKISRLMLDEAGFAQVKIVASSDLDETIIESIRGEGGCIDIYGVGTKVATGSGPGGCALGGVYKLVRFDGQPKLKVTSDLAKATLPDRKRLLRVEDDEGQFLLNIICRQQDEVVPGDQVYNPANPAESKTIPQRSILKEIRQPVMDQGQLLLKKETLDHMADRCSEQLQRLPKGSLRLANPHVYKVAISSKLRKLRNCLIKQYHDQLD